MIFKHIITDEDANKNVLDDKGSSKKQIETIDEYIKDGKHVFILIFMNNCGPCEATRPEWDKIEDALKSEYVKRDDVVIIDVNKDYLGKLNKIGNVDGFPTMKYIKDGNISDFDMGNRDVDTFVSWIESKIINKKSPESLSTRLIHPYDIHPYDSNSNSNSNSNKGKGKGKSIKKKGCVNKSKKSCTRKAKKSCTRKAKKSCTHSIKKRCVRKTKKVCTRKAKKSCARKAKKNCNVKG